MLRNSVVIIGLILLWFSPVHATPLKGIVFADTDQEDVNLTQEQPMGMLSLLLKHSAGSLEFEQQQVSFKRGWFELNRLGNACMYNKFKSPEREKLGYFSKLPISIYPPLRLITLKKNAHLFPHPVDLTKPDTIAKHSIGVALNRSYGDTINAYIEQSPDLFFKRGGMDSSETLIDMMAVGRVKAIIEYSEEVSAYLERNNKQLEFDTVMIRGVEKVDRGYMVCAKTPMGKQLIDRIDAIMQQKAFQQEYIEMHNEFFTQEERLLLQPELLGIFENSESHSTPHSKSD
ncbi:transporter substrate-binding domain-containing protein [Shewanella sp. WXL01]|uniref:transporter substrate-binding domain-containing protein n=1 Tax=Shewanella sp. WXL01 TaxID=2709721 RepID=UPI0014386994|nr:transporter substrate-binding domain-containing protein [Shewanella sp. WXL01]NKF49792.1 transporter substrate-binding domain-containing protein [Shewanella sp. WXL01]